MIVPITRKEKLLNAIATSGNVDFLPKTREELFLFKILGADVNTPTPITRKELLYQHIIDGTIPTFEPRTRLEKFIMAAAGVGLELPVVLTREEYWWAEISDSAYETITGAIVHFISKRARAIKSLIANISYTQDLHGYANPWPAGGGKNVLPTLTEAQTVNGVTATPNADGSITLTGTASAIAYFDLITGFDSTAYAGYIVTGLPDDMASNSSTICYRISTASSRASLQDIQRGASGTYVSNTIVDNGTNLVFSIRVNNGYALPAGGLTLYPMMRASSASADFEPYANICPISGWTGANVYHSGADTSDATTYSITFPAAAGTVYGGTLDVTTGKLTVDRAMVDLGTKKWYLSTSAGRTRFRASITDVERISSPNIVAPMLCSAYKTETANNTYTGKQGISLQQNATDVYVYDAQRESMTTADFKTAMSGVQLCYKLATPQTYQLTPTEVTTLLGDNTIWADTGDVSVTY